MAGQKSQQPGPWGNAYNDSSGTFTSPPAPGQIPADPHRFFQGMSLY
jgi:hypothetical protein